MNREIAQTFFDEWQKGQLEFSLLTSGSTGAPKAIILKKEQMQWSAANTASVIKPQPSDSLLCCLPCNKVGGLMMLVRSIEWQIPIEIIEPIANPFLTEQEATIVSLTPYQLFHALNNVESVKHLKKTRAVIIGGGELSIQLEQKIKTLGFDSTIFYHSYGMTETYSHIALRAINGSSASPYFTPFMDVKVSADENNCTLIQLPFDSEPLPTTDIIRMQPNGSFEVIGRADHIINTGGIKIQPEQIEKAIIEKLNPLHQFIISSEKDEVLGNRIILVAEKSFEYELSDLGFLKEINPYAVPKEIRIIEKFERNEGGKVKRIVYK